MKTNYLVGPLIGMAAFVGYYFYWKAHPQTPPPVEASQVDAYARRDGRGEATSLLAADKLVLIETGPQVGWDAERREIAVAKYGVELRHLEQLSTESFVRYVESFNRVMRPRVLEKHGRGFFDALHQEAIALHETRARKKL